jgi:hypothetical protein
MVETLAVGEILPQLRKDDEYIFEDVCLLTLILNIIHDLSNPPAVFNPAHRGRIFGIGPNGVIDSGLICVCDLV